MPRRWLLSCGLLLVLVLAACGGDGAATLEGDFQGSVDGTGDQPGVVGEGGGAGSAEDPADTGSQPGSSGSSSDQPGNSNGEEVDEPGDAPSDADGEGLSPCEQTVTGISPGSIYLLSVTIDVKDIGPAGKYVWLDPCVSDAVAAGVEGTAILGSQGSCLFLTPVNFEQLFLAALQESDAAAPWQMDSVFFSAAVRQHQDDYVSIGYDGEVGITSGGYATGGTGRDGQQWIIEGGSIDFPEPTILEAESELYGTLPVGIGVVQAVWVGASIENFSGEEASGSVTATCEFAYKPSD